MASAEADPAERQVEQIESLCMNCHKNGTTRLLLTRIPFFRDVVLMSFSCPECGFKNSEIQSAGEIQQRGVKYTFRADEAADLERQVVKGDSCIVRIEDVDLEIPPGRGQLTNVEGLVSMVRDDLEVGQDVRREAAPEVATKIGEIIEDLGKIATGAKLPFTITLDDPTGNSSFEPSTKDGRGKWSRSTYARTPEQNEALGLAPGQESEDVNGAPATDIRPEYHPQGLFPAGQEGNMAANVDDEDIAENQVYEFPTQCPGCTRPATVNMKMVRIPHFDEVVIMAVSCDACGYRSSDVKTGGAIPAKGKKIVLQVRNREDLSRDILKAEHCALSCPELSLNVEPGTLGGRFTTIEGLLTQVRDDLKTNVFDTSDQGAVAEGDSMIVTERQKWKSFFDKLDEAINGDIPFTVVLEDPLAKSYVQSFTAPDPDPQITTEEYDRTAQEEEDLGLNDIQTEGYEQAEQKPAESNGKPEIDVEEVRRELHKSLLG
ncbi:hypothetical protein FH972_022489 [Carpinus fangiana]|uniref:Zinc finger ZPR1-type domain-containing protein n=1 Tax=Carpinus fangiana TaxID=176857 RepID=A0A5N6KSQ2_9ROSI|nr:hypothetical protein FH972_022489 [Carpinus fangiana]